MNNKEIDLGNEKIGKLLLKFSIPCVISMLVAALYNIVDQIYIGHIADVGVYCNAATNVVYPLTLIALAICLLIGDGAAALFSLSRGRKEQDKANKAIGNCLVLQIICLVVMTIICLIFKEQLLNLFGVTEQSYEFAYQYMSIIVLGFPVYMFGQGLNSVIRSDGSPKYAMMAISVGAVFNIIFDPIFIFGLDMGIKGAALATILGQLVSAVITIIYLRKPKTFQFTKDSLKLEWNTIKTIVMLGISSFITQVSIVIIITVVNNLVRIISDSYYGDTIPLAVIGIVMKVFGIVVSACIGISLGGQPIVGFNYGAGKIDRVKETFKKILLACSILGIIAFLIFELCPDIIINIFGTGNGDAYTTYARYCLKIFLGGILLTCMTKACTIFLQSSGASVKSMILSVARDVVFFVPAVIFLGLNYGVVTMLWAAVISDILTAILALFLIKSEFKKINSFSKAQEAQKEEQTANIQATQNGDKKDNLVITIAREYGSGGRFVAKLLAEKLGIKCYDKELIELIAKESNFTEEYIKENEEKKTTLGGTEYNNADRLVIAETSVIRNLANNESCIIVGRCANYVLKDYKNVFNVFLYTDEESKINRAVKYYKLPEKEAKDIIIKTNKEREKHYNYYTGLNWKDFSNYNIVLNVDTFGPEKTAEILKEIVENNVKNI